MKDFHWKALQRTSDITIKVLGNRSKRGLQGVLHASPLV